MSIKLMFRTIVGIAFWLVVLGCTNQEPILVGFAGELTGRRGELGVAGRDGAQLAVDEINQQGGINGRPITLIIKDDKGDPEVARQVNRELIAQDVVAIIGHITSGQTAAVLDQMNAAKVVLLSPTSSSTQFSDQVDYLFRVMPGFAGMLVGELYLARLQEAIEQIDIGEEGTSFIVYQRGTLVAYPDQRWVQEQRNLNNLSLVQKGMAGEKSFEIFYDKDQKEWLIGSVTPMGQNWAVIATQPVVLVSRPLRFFLIAAILAFAMSFGLYALSHRYAAKQIISPITVLAQKADALSSGQYEPLPVNQMGEFSEMITLGQSFNRMVEAVAERTKKLMAANQSLRESEANLAKAQQIAHLGSYSWDIQTNEIFWSEELKLILGITTKKPSFGLTASLVHPDDQERFFEAERLTLHEGRPFDLEYRIIRSDGMVRYIHNQAQVIRNEDGKAVQMIGTSMDIT